MSAADPQGLDRMFDLMADLATEGLARAESEELDVLRRRHPDLDPEALELTAAALDLHLSVEPSEPLPESLRHRIEADAFAFLSGDRSLLRPRSPRPDEASGPRRRRGAWWAPAAVSGWLAAAAAVAVMLAGGPAPGPEGGAPGASAAVDPAARRARLVATADDLVTLAWQPTGDEAAAGATGDLVWSPGLQQGFMRFRGLAPNDPSAEQYQLWIFDAARDERHPVDGGVFDVAPGQGEVVVPFHPRLPVSKAVLFAVTVERPGGVVVSSREHLPLVAKAPL